jgi:CAAX prenyl protease-like protein
MDSASAKINVRKLMAFTLPLATLMALSGLRSLLGSSSQYWIYPIQTVLCGVLILVFWRDYEFRAVIKPVFTIAIGLLVFVFWIAPQAFCLGFTSRHVGFDPSIFSSEPAIYAATLGLRFLRLVVVIPLVEEIFFRGFLLRYLIKEAFQTVSIGVFSWFSFTAVAVCFGLVHSPADWIAGVFAGALYNLVVYRTKNLASAVLAHAITNLLLGVWIMKTGQWGFW